MAAKKNVCSIDGSLGRHINPAIFSSRASRPFLNRFCHARKFFLLRRNNQIIIVPFQGMLDPFQTFSYKVSALSKHRNCII